MIARCDGAECSVRDECLRYTTPVDPTEFFTNWVMVFRQDRGPGCVVRLENESADGRGTEQG